MSVAKKITLLQLPLRTNLVSNGYPSYIERLYLENPYLAEIIMRTPQFYQAQLEKLKDPLRFSLHDEKKTVPYIWDPKSGEAKKTCNIPIKTVKLDQFDNCLMGSEKIVLGFVRKIAKNPIEDSKIANRPVAWVPKLEEFHAYSEVLQKNLILTGTKEVLQLIDDHSGFDNYILQSDDIDLCTKLGLFLKRKMLITLAHSSHDLSTDVMKKYDKYKIPIEEAEWYGLPVDEACDKQLAIEDSHKHERRPWKYYFAQKYNKELIEEK